MRGIGSGDFGVGAWIERWARTRPDHPALITAGGPVGYAELAVRIRRLANGLRGLGVRRGDRVAWLGPNHAAFLETLFAAGRLGAVLAPVNHRLGTSERAEVMAQTRPAVLVLHATDEAAAPAWVRHRVVVGAGGADAGPGGLAYEPLVTGSPDLPLDEAVDLDDLLLLPHTSGTTGSPKAVMLTHGNVTWNAVNMVTTAGFRGDDVTIAIAPLFRAGGTGVNVLPVLFAGGTVVVPDEPDPDAILRSMERDGVTVGFGNPDLLDALASSARWTSTDLSRVRFVITGGAPVPERLIHTYGDRGVMLLQGYGLSEAGPVALLLDAARALDKLGSAGKPPPFTDVRVVDEAGEDVAPGETGELVVRGPNVMAGYWERPDATRAALSAAGWLHTGDAARMDDDGYVWIVDRVEARFESGGRLVYPGDVERVLLAHPSVVEAGVVGAPDPDGDTVVTAFVVAAPGSHPSEAELRAFCRDRLAPHQVPASISTVSGLPRNAVGKLLRAELARLAGGGP